MIFESANSICFAFVLFARVFFVCIGRSRFSLHARLFWILFYFNFITSKDRARKNIMNASDYGWIAHQSKIPYNSNVTLFSVQMVSLASFYWSAQTMDTVGFHIVANTHSSTNGRFMYFMYNVLQGDVSPKGNESFSRNKGKIIYFKFM